MKDENSPLIVVVGQTASGKSELAIKLAEYFGGEIICADSMTIYRSFDIGTAKPSQEEQLKIPHHMIDVADPNSSFNTKKFQTMANHIIQDIARRNKLPILVGGSGLYVDSILFSYKFLSPPSTVVRIKLDQMSLTELLQEAGNLKLDTKSIDTKNKRRVVRLIETNGLKSTKNTTRLNTIVVGLQIPREELTARIEGRINLMIKDGLENEVRRLANLYGWEIEQMKAVGYREWRDYFGGSISRAEAVNRIIKDTIALSKKQNTWFKRNKSIHWFSNRYKFGKVVDLVTTTLNK